MLIGRHVAADADVVFGGRQSGEEDVGVLQVVLHSELVAFGNLLDVARRGH